MVTLKFCESHKLWLMYIIGGVSPPVQSFIFYKIFSSLFNVYRHVNMGAPTHQEAIYVDDEIVATIWLNVDQILIKASYFLCLIKWNWLSQQKLDRIRSFKVLNDWQCSCGKFYWNRLIGWKVITVRRGFVFGTSTAYLLHKLRWVSRLSIWSCYFRKIVFYLFNEQYFADVVYNVMKNVNITPLVFSFIIIEAIFDKFIKIG